MEERLAVIAHSAQDLQDKLQGFLEGKGDLENVYQGQVKKNKEALGLFGGDADMAANMANTVQAWIDKGKHAKLLELWVKGLSMDWGKLHGQSKPRRIAAPTYPFARQRYWIEGAAGADVPVSRNLSAPIVLPAQPSQATPLALFGRPADQVSQRQSDRSLPAIALSQATPLALFGRPADHVNHRQSDRPLPAIALSQASLSAPETAFTAARTSVTLSAQAEATQTMHSLSLTPKAIT
jgi:hypothetical protein